MADEAYLVGTLACVGRRLGSESSELRDEIQMPIRVLAASRGLGRLDFPLPSCTCMHPMNYLPVRGDRNPQTLAQQCRRRDDVAYVGFVRRACIGIDAAAAGAESYYVVLWYIIVAFFIAMYWAR